MVWKPLNEININYPNKNTLRTPSKKLIIIYKKKWW